MVGPPFYKFMSASRTPWRKSRTFGDIHGGRVNRRMTDNIFNRLHSIQRPSLHDILPIVREDNPSRDFVFPASSDMILARLSQLPSDDVAGITHLWLRRWDGSVTSQAPFGEFICGSGVRMIVIYAWPKDLRLRFGKRKPASKQLRAYAPWTTDLRCTDREWSLTWTPESLEDWCLNHLLLHEVGHHVDWYRNTWSAANGRQTEARADAYAAQWSMSGRTQSTGLGDV
jgi:hypothetical protein